MNSEVTFNSYKCFFDLANDKQYGKEIKQFFADLKKSDIVRNIVLHL